MHFCFYPKHDYGCPHVMHCPHLGGAALGTLVLAADEQTDWMEALHRQIDSLRAGNTAQYHKIEEQAARIEQLERELKAERQKQFKGQKQEPPEPEAGEAAPTQGAETRSALGHPGWYRKRPTEFDRLVLVPAPCHCPYCDGLVKPRPDLPAYDHIQEDWTEGRRVVTCYRHELGRCRSCRRWPQQPGVDELLRKMIGPNVRADSLFLQYDIGLTLRFFAAVIQWVKRGCDWHRKWKNRRGAERDREAEWLRQELERLQKMPTTANSDRATRLRKRIRKYSGEWLTFLDHPGVAPTNNLAEQALRRWSSCGSSPSAVAARREPAPGNDDDGDRNRQAPGQKRAHVSRDPSYHGHESGATRHVFPAVMGLDAENVFEGLAKRVVFAARRSP